MGFLDRFKKDKITKNMIASGIIKPVAMIVSYIYVRFVLQFLGIERYGVWVTILTILSWIGYFDIGIGNGLRNKLTEALSKGDRKKCAQMISSAYVFMFIAISIICLILCVIAQFCDWNLIFGVNDIDEDLSFIITISIVFVSVGFVLAICKSILYAFQKASLVSIIELAVQLINLIGIIIFRYTVNGNILTVALLYGLSTLLVNLIFTIIIFVRNKDLSFRFKDVNIKTGLFLTKLGAKFFIIQICALILFSTDSLIISMMYGAADVTPYSNVNKLFNAIVSVYTAFILPIWSGITKANSEQDYGKIKSIITKLNLFMIPFFALSVALIFIFRPISNIWLGVEITYPTLLIIFGAFYAILSIWCNTYSAIVNGLEWLKIAMIVAISQAVLNIPLSLLFAKTLNMEISGVFLGTIVVMIIPTLIFPIFVFRWVHKKTLTSSKPIPEEEQQ